MFEYIYIQACTYVRVPSRLFFLVVFVLMCHQLLIGGKKMLSSGIELTKYTHPQSCCIQRRPIATVARTIVYVLVALVTHTGVFFGMVFIERIAMVSHGLIKHKSLTSLSTKIAFFNVAWRSWIVVTVFMHLMGDRALDKDATL